MAYSTTVDLLTGQIPLPSQLNAQKFVDDAADEIDSRIGYVYQTPLDVSDTGPLSRPSRLLLKRLNNLLASGRLILAVASPEENNSLHAYGWSLVREANTAINAIAHGDIILDGATVVPTQVEPSALPLIANVDSESSVEAFYDRVANPNYTYPYNYPRINPDGLVY